jgi:hypothetical protein
VVPLVFKTSLGAVRSPEGSTPSLLRQELFSQTIFAACKWIAKKAVTVEGEGAYVFQ